VISVPLESILNFETPETGSFFELNYRLRMNQSISEEDKILRDMIQ